MGVPVYDQFEALRARGGGREPYAPAREQKVSGDGMKVGTKMNTYINIGKGKSFFVYQPFGKHRKLLLQRDDARLCMARV